MYTFQARLRVYRDADGGKPYYSNVLPADLEFRRR